MKRRCAPSWRINEGSISPCPPSWAWPQPAAHWALAPLAPLPSRRALRLLRDGFWVATWAACPAPVTKLILLKGHAFSAQLGLASQLAFASQLGSQLGFDSQSFSPVHPMRAPNNAQAFLELRLRHLESFIHFTSQLPAHCILLPRRYLPRNRKRPTSAPVVPLLRPAIPALPVALRAAVNRRSRASHGRLALTALLSHSN